MVTSRSFTLKDSMWVRTIWELSIVLQWSNQDRMHHKPGQAVHPLHQQSNKLSTSKKNISHYVCFYSNAGIVLLLNLFLTNYTFHMVSYLLIFSSTTLMVSPTPKSDKAHTHKKKKNLASSFHGKT